MKIERVDAEIQKELSQLIANAINDPRLDGAMISILRVETTKDLKYCKVFVSIMGGNDAKEILKVLQNSAGFLKNELFHKLKVRAIPDLLFRIDESIGYGIKIESILRTLDIKKDEPEVQSKEEN